MTAQKSSLKRRKVEDICTRPGESVGIAAVPGGRWSGAREGLGKNRGHRSCRMWYKVRLNASQRIRRGASGFAFYRGRKQAGPPAGF
ncbi:hypothetical protein AB3G45_09875 [Shinella sp. S4-D37]